MGARFDPFDGPAPRWRNIAARRPFLRDLAAGLLDWTGEAAPEALSDAVVLLPNRRAARAFSQALSEVADGRPVLMPQVRPLGDLEEDEAPFAPGALGLDLAPAIDPLRRRFELARLAAEHRRDITPLAALDMADALAAFLDACHLEEVENPERVRDLVDGDMARHWKVSADFLALGVEVWPKRLAELGRVDPAWRRVKLLRLLAESWRAAPPAHPVIVAGSTGTEPAIAAVMAAAASAPLGCVVLPGLDLSAPEAVWAQVDWNHPQHALKRLLASADVARASVRPWFAPDDDPRAVARERVLAEALRPAEATHDWRVAIAALRREAVDAGQAADPVSEGLQGLSVLEARDEEDAASAIALMMRQTLETPGKTCALVTPDRDLSRRVAARLERWGVVADSSAGEPLSRLSAGRLLALASAFMADPLDPHVLLGLLKHPSLAAHDGLPRLPTARETLERRALRQSRPRDWAALKRRLLPARRRDGAEPSEAEKDRLAEARALVERLEALSGAARAPFAPDAAAVALAGLVEALAGQAVWGGQDGEAAAALIDALIEGGAALPALDATAFARLVRRLLDETTVRLGGATHGALRILGAREGRLVRADRMILAGLEDGVWPSPAPTDPFLSRPMREKLGLPPPERELGSSAHDFIQAAQGPEVVLVARQRRGGQPAVRSRWLWRLDMLTAGANRKDAPVALSAPVGVADWTRALDAPPAARRRPASRPAPRPPVTARPRELPVTAVERWVRDPYHVYARYVLGLKPLDRPGQAGDALLRGQAVHAAIEKAAELWPDVWPDDAADTLGGLIEGELAAAGFDAAAMARERLLARRLARWLATEFEPERRGLWPQRWVEVEGAITLAAPFAPFRLTARADRLEAAGRMGAVIDFKTGGPPSIGQVHSHLAPQLSLTAAILAQGGFGPDIPALHPGELVYVQLIGRDPPGRVIDVSGGNSRHPLDAAGVAEAAREGLARRIARFDDPDTPYRSWETPQFIGRMFGPYDHLARVWEWHVAGGGEGVE